MSQDYICVCSLTDMWDINLHCFNIYCYLDLINLMEVENNKCCCRKWQGIWL